MKVRILLLLTAFVAAGCAKISMTVMEQQALQRPAADAAQVIFLRPGSTGSAADVSLFEVTGGNIEFIGLIVPDVRVPYRTGPGSRVFMVVSDTADFMEANLAGGKNYYAVVAPQIGFWQARFSLWPYKNDPSAPYDTAMPGFEKQSSSGELVEISPAALAWYQERKTDIAAKYRKYWPEWQKMAPEEIARRSLVPADGT